jgi:hypothetical protein
MKSLGYKIKYNQNDAGKRYLVNNKWVTRRQIPEIKEKLKLIDYRYNNTERGRIIEIINGIFSRPFKKSNKRKKKWIPEIDRKGIWLIIMNHICRMKEQFPGSDGRLCFFCHKPWTYIRRLNNGSGKKGPTIMTNFSLDRFDCNVTYKEGNIVCCCGGCNDRKGSSTRADWKIFIEREKELEKINHEMEKINYEMEKINYEME